MSSSFTCVSGQSRHTTCILPVFIRYCWFETSFSVIFHTQFCTNAQREAKTNSLADPMCQARFKFMVATVQCTTPLQSHPDTRTDGTQITPTTGTSQSPPSSWLMTQPVLSHYGCLENTQRGAGQEAFPQLLLRESSEPHPYVIPLPCVDLVTSLFPSSAHQEARAGSNIF